MTQDAAQRPPDAALEALAAAIVASYGHYTANKALEVERVHLEALRDVLP